MLKVTLLLALTSFGLNIAIVNDGKTIEAYYAPYTRFWELLVGSMLAYAKLNQENIFLNERYKLNSYFNDLFPACNGWEWRKIHEAYSLTGVSLIAIGLFYITRQEHFPGWWALLPTLGAAFIIAAGSGAWFNRVILSSRIMVWFGLISYPLYLWHWPILAFARIITIETPSIAIRATAICISIAFAWLTCRVIEKYFRSDRHKRTKAIALLILMVIFGCVGFYTYRQNGLGPREISKVYDAQSNNNAVRNSSSQANIALPEVVQHNSLIFNDTHKASEVQTTIDATDKSPQANMGLPVGHNPKVMVLGDSHGGRLAVGLAFKYGPYVANYTSAGCIPFYNVDRYDSRFVVGTCMKQMNEALDLFEKSKSMNTIILSSMGPVYLSGEVFNGQDIARVTGDGVTLDGKKEVTDRYQVFKIGMANTFKRLLLKKKHIIFVVDVPELGFDPHACLKARPLQLAKKDICAVSRSEYDLRSKKYKKIIYEVLSNFPEVEVFDPTNLLCDKKWCWAIQDSKILYFDPDHLSVDGAKYIVNYLAPIIEKYNPDIPKFDYN